jgi:hypothetical protein
MKQLIYLNLFILIFCACQKENNAKDFNGTYTGSFRTIVDQKMISADFELELAPQKFEVKKGLKLGNGTFKVIDTKTINFEDKNIWTADFDWNLILNGSYTYEAKGDSLILTKNLENSQNTIYNYYQYRLRRNN